jgi:hypothetical protein
MRDNEAAHKLYLRMGFRDYCATAVRIVARDPHYVAPAAG